MRGSTSCGLVRRRHLGWLLFGCRRIGLRRHRRSPESPRQKQIAPIVQRTNGVVVPPAGSAPGVPQSSRGRSPAALFAPGNGRLPPDSRVTFAPPLPGPAFSHVAGLSAQRRSGATPPGRCRGPEFSTGCSISAMCFDLDSRPPIPPIAGAAVDGQRIDLHASDGTRFLAFDATADTPTGAAIVILPDVRGLHHVLRGAGAALRRARHRRGDDRLLRPNRPDR